ncbi:MAG: hypothetical protein WDA08_00725 [Weeksellaceae bacterium]
MKNKARIIKGIIILILMFILWLIFFPFNSNSRICESEVEISKKLLNHLNDEMKLEKICDYQNKVLVLNEFNYLDSIYEFFVIKNKRQIEEGVDYYSNVILKTNRDEFINYFSNLDKKEQFKIWSFLGISEYNGLAPY